MNLASELYHSPLFFKIDEFEVAELAFAWSYCLDILSYTTEASDGIIATAMDRGIRLAVIIDTLTAQRTLFNYVFISFVHLFLLIPLCPKLLLGLLISKGSDFVPRHHYSLFGMVGSPLRLVSGYEMSKRYSKNPSIGLL